MMRGIGCVWAWREFFGLWNVCVSACACTCACRQLNVVVVSLVLRCVRQVLGHDRMLALYPTVKRRLEVVLRDWNNKQAKALLAPWKGTWAFLCGPSSSLPYDRSAPCLSLSSCPVVVH